MVPTTWKGHSAHRLDARHLGGPLAGPGHLRARDPHRPANDLVVLADPGLSRVLAGEEGHVPALQVRRQRVLPHAPAFLGGSALHRRSRTSKIPPLAVRAAPRDPWQLRTFPQERTARARRDLYVLVGNRTPMSLIHRSTRRSEVLSTDYKGHIQADRLAAQFVRASRLGPSSTR